MANLGVHVYEQATAVSIPVVADSGIPFVVGCAPVHTLPSAAAVNRPVLATSWDEAVEKLGFSYNWEDYPLCEFVYSHFQLFGCQPAIFYNVLDPATMKQAVAATEMTVTDHKVTLPFEAIHSTIKLSASVTTPAQDGGTDTTTTVNLVEDEDYTVLYSEAVNGQCTVELLEDGAAYSAAAVTAEYATVTVSSLQVADIVEGVTRVDECMTAVGKIPDILCAPGWSHNTVVAAVMATKADAGIMGLFRAKALIDADSTAEGVTEYSALAGYKSRQNFVDENQILCWPMVKLGDYQFHMSTQLAGLMASVDTENAGCPYESPSNKCYKMDSCVLADGTEVNLSWPQTNIVAGDYGVVTAVNFMGMGWTAKGNYTACYPSNTDVKDMFIPVSRMFDWVANTLIRTFWSKLDKPMNRRLIDTILDTCNIWLGGLVGTEKLLGARAVMLEEENTLVDLMAGILHIHIYITPPSPMQECDFTLEYDVSYVESALAA